MYVIGELINGMFKNPRSAMEEKAKAPIQEIALAQVKAGASALDINVGPAKVEALETLNWLIDTVEEVTDIPLVIDNPKWSIQKEIIPRLKGKNCVINSCKADEDALEKFIGLAVENEANLIALTIDKDGVPADVAKRVELGALIGAKAMEGGLPMPNLYIDPIILPVNVAPQQPMIVIETIQQLRMLSDPPPHFNLGLSNLSQNCSNRSLINRTYLAMAIAAGLDAAIVDALDKDLMDAMITTELLMEKAIYCDSFLEAYLMSKKS